MEPNENPSTYFTDYGPNQGLFSVPNGPETTSFGIQGALYATPLPAGIIPHHYAASVYTNKERDEKGLINYPESSQRASIHGSRYSLSGSTAEPIGFRNVPAITDSDRVMRSSTIHSHPQRGVHLYHIDPPDTSYHRHVPQGHQRSMVPHSSSANGNSAYSGENSMTEMVAFLPEVIPPLKIPESRVLSNPSIRTAPDDVGGSDHWPYSDNEFHNLHNIAPAIQTQRQSSIPMCNSSGWSSASPSSACDILDHARPRLSPGSGSIVILDSDSSVPCSPSEHTGHSTPDIPLSSNGISRPRKKKSKMHKCEVCGKMFPRPSGLKTHMNTHNNLKPFPCGFSGCPRTFTVRSNAKRHLRTHGIDISTDKSTAIPYVVGFSTPTVVASSTHEMNEVPRKLRWMPPSLTTRINADKLSTLSDGDSDSDDPYEYSVDWKSALSIPLRPVTPSSHTDNPYNQLEERDSYLDAPSYPYHPSQFRTLPGPATAILRSHALI